MVAALGLMSGTSMDGIDAAILRTDGLARVEAGPFRSVHYDDAFRQRLRAVLGGGGPVAEVERDLTHAHAWLVRELLADAGLAAADIRVVGMHGHTILHRPAEGRTWQIGDGALLAALTAIDVVNDFRAADVAAGGEGAPFAPLYHAALSSAAIARPVAVLNLGGVGNVSWIGAGLDIERLEDTGGELIAFDTGPGNALIDDWVRQRTGRPWDEDGALAAAGQVDDEVLAALLDNPYFDRPPPKSLDRDDFDIAPVAGLGLEDGAATLTAFTASAVVRAAAQFPVPVERWLVTGGGRHNPSLMAAVAAAVDAPLAPVEAVGWNGDVLEAQAFAYLAVRSLAGLPLSLPTTTGVAAPVTGGHLHPARSADETL